MVLHNKKCCKEEYVVHFWWRRCKSFHLDKPLKQVLVRNLLPVKPAKRLVKPC